MDIKTEKKSIYLTVPKKEVEEYDGAYFYHKGLQKEDQLVDLDIPNCVNATFEGFEVLSDFEQTELLGETPSVPSVTAKLHYYADIKI